jgi:trehalose 6-phosphate phosphatase
MTDFRDHWDLISLRLSTAPRVCLLSDLDGTLVPLVDHPDQVRLPSNVRRLFQSFIKKGRGAAGIVSGRALDDLTSRVAIDGIWYVGNHGFEVRRPDGLETRFFDAGDIEYVNLVRDELATETAGVPGILLEHKGPVLAVHYRQVELPRIAEVERAFLRVMERHRPRMMMANGCRVFEARIRGVRNKGTAVRHIRRELPPGSLVIYFGDDVTDADAFRELQGIGIGVEVGGSDSSLAHYTLPDPAAVWEVLERLLDALHADNGSR